VTQNNGAYEIKQTERHQDKHILDVRNTRKDY